MKIIRRSDQPAPAEQRVEKMRVVGPKEEEERKVYSNREERIDYGYSESDDLDDADQMSYEQHLYKQYKSHRYHEKEPFNDKYSSNAIQYVEKVSIFSRL